MLKKFNEGWIDCLPRCNNHHDKDYQSLDMTGSMVLRSPPLALCPQESYHWDDEFLIFHQM